MATTWLTFQSFQHGQEILKAINTLAIHLKLKLSGMADETRVQEAEQARAVLVKFLEELEAVVQQGSRMETAPILGADPRLRQLATNYLAARRHQRFRSRLFTGSIDGVKALLHSEIQSDQAALVECLDELRMLVEEHIQEDAGQILGAL